MATKNECHQLVCDAFGSDAAGVCRLEGMAVFVPGMLPGEEGIVRLLKVTRSYAFGRLERLVKASPDRRTPDCPAYPRCGGCSCLHMRYEASLAYKRSQAKELISRVGGIDLDIPPVMGMEPPFGYRNKGTYPIAADDRGNPVCGFYAPHSHRLVPLPPEGCAIQRRESAAAVQAVLGWMKAFSVPAYDEASGKGCLRNVMTRTGADGKTAVTLVSMHDCPPHVPELIRALQDALPGLSGVSAVIRTKPDNAILDGELKTLYGEVELEMTLCGLRFSVSPKAFFQVNPEQTEKLYGLVQSFAELTGQETVADVYCGAGTISLVMAQRAKKVLGIEIVPEAIENAKRNAERNGIRNTEFVCAAAEVFLPRMAEKVKPDVIVLDPPRKGCEPEVLEAIAKAAPQRVVYVSCGISSLARDLKILKTLGYEVGRIQCVDMFCWTGDVETVCCLHHPQ